MNWRRLHTQGGKSARLLCSERFDSRLPLIQSFLEVGDLHRGRPAAWEEACRLDRNGFIDGGSVRSSNSPVGASHLLLLPVDGLHEAEELQESSSSQRAKDLRPTELYSFTEALDQR